MDYPRKIKGEKDFSFPSHSKIHAIFHIIFNKKRRKIIWHVSVFVQNIFLLLIFFSLQLGLWNFHQKGIFSFYFAQFFLMKISKWKDREIFRLGMKFINMQIRRVTRDFPFFIFSFFLFFFLPKWRKLSWKVCCWT